MSGLGDFVNKVGDAVEHGVESATQKAGELADAGLDAAAGLARKVGADGVAENLDDLGDKIADLAGGEIKERELGQTTDPKELIRGEPSAIHDAVEALQKMGDSIGKTGDALRTVNTADWTGSAAEEFHTEFAKQPKLWWEGADAMHKASGVLDGWYHEVTAAQTKAADAIAKWEAADTEETTRKNQWNALSDEQKRKTTLTDTWTSIRNEAREILRGARTQRDNAAASAAAALAAATEAAPTEPPFTERWTDNLSDLSGALDQAKLNFTSGLLTSFTGIVQFVRQVSPIDAYNLTHPAEYFSGMSDLGTGLVVAAADPGATVSSILSGARKNPSEFLGSLTGDLITTVGTGGAGAAKPALSALDKIGDVSKVSKATHTVASAAEHAPHTTPHAPSSTPHTPSSTPHESGAPTSTHPTTEAPSPTTTASEPGTPTGTHPSTSEPGTQPHATTESPTQPGTTNLQPETPTHTPDSGTPAPDNTTPGHTQPDAPQQANPEPAAPDSHPSGEHPGDAPQTPHQQPSDTPAVRPDAEVSSGPNPSHETPIQHPDPDSSPLTRTDSPDTPTDHGDGSPHQTHDGTEPTHPDGDGTNPNGHDNPSPENQPTHHDSPQEHPTPQERAEADQGAGDTARENGADHDRVEGDKTCSEDPVDIATGEFLLPETDVDLPGVLALTLRRTHRSNYRYGRWFGPSWSTTLDMRLVVEHEGVTFLGEDGIMLAYPHTEVGAAAEPVTGGQAWTLTRTEVGGYRIWDQQREILWHFAPEPTLDGIESRLGNYAISAITDRHRNRIRFHYDTDGAPVEVSHSGGYRVRIDTAAGRVTRLSVLGTDAAGAETRTQLRKFGYNAGELSTVVNAVGATMSYTYDDEHRLTSWTDSNGNQMVNTYDESGRIIFQRGTAGILDTDFDYLEFPDGTGRLTTVTDSLGGVTTHGFDRDLRLRDLVDPSGGRIHTDYNADRKPLTVTAPDGTVTRYRYTGEGDVAEITRPDGRTVQIDYMWRNRPIRVTDADGSVRQQDWDTNGNLAAIVDAAGARTEYAYHPSGAIAAITNAGDTRTRIEVDAAGLAVQVTDPSGAITRIERDCCGRPIRVIDPLDAQTHYQWAPDGKLLRRVDPDGYTESWTYDGEGNLLTQTDRAGNTTRFTYGAFDLLRSRTDPDGSTTHYTWDSQRRLTTVTNPLDQTWTYTYNPAGHLTAQTDYTGATTRYAYDTAGRVTAITPTTGDTRHHTYDLLGRLTAVSADGGDWIRYTHAPAGQVLTAVSGRNDDPTHSLEFTYTATGQLASQQLDDQPAMRHEHDRYGRRIRRTTPTDATTGWDYDHTGKVRTLSADGHHLVFHYDPVGRIDGWRIGEIAITRTLSDFGRVTAQEVIAHPATSLNLDTGPRPEARTLRHDEYAYRPDGYLLNHTLIRPDTTHVLSHYTLDPAGRVTAITRDSALTEQYTYDPLGNITSTLPPRSPKDTGTTITKATEMRVSHDTPQFDADRRREYRNNLLIHDGRTRYHYDEVGRLIRKTVTRLSRKPDIWHYRYNSFDQLTDIWTPDRQWWRYTYDALGRRTTKQHLTNDGVVIERIDYTWDGTHLVEQHATDSVTRWQYRPDSYTPITQHTDQTSVDREFYAIITDLAGTPVEVVTPAEATTAGIAVVGLWGSATWNGDAATLLRFPGQQYDSETGLHYNLNRFYDPGTGRYLTQDPLGLAPASNPGIYPHNPTTWIDPLGLIPERCNVEVGGGASLDNISAGEAQRIQNAADKIGHPITLVGSRAEGTAHAFSDWDYIVEDFNNQIRKKIYNSLPIGPAELGYGRRFDILRGPVDTSRPYITFNPR
ncbi:putative T7SS-secreted protein [Nocardia vinacea]|uniref:putative T7SS-secreted protein n=1 Tax=Nocardia vinacea TaxID=96468 RepID=UPI0033FD0409